MTGDHIPRLEMTDKAKSFALSELTLLDLSQLVAGPFCTKLLGDQGAEVIKIEKPREGDRARRQGPFLKDDPSLEKSGLFFYLNTNKKSITLNLKTTTGKEILKELVKKVDVLVESFRPEVAHNLGIDYLSFEKINHRLIMLSISNFGQHGPYRDYFGAHNVLCALSGWQHLCGDPQREPLQAPDSLEQYTAGLFGALAILTAVYYRRQTGIGQYIDTSIMETAIPIQTFFPLRFSYLGEIRTRKGNYINPGSGYIVPCKDGYVGINIFNSTHWELLCHFVGMPELLEDPRFSNFGNLAEHSRELSALLQDVFIDRYKEEIFHSAQEWRIPIAPVFNPEDLYRSPQYESRGYFQEVEHPIMGKITIPGTPFKMTETTPKWVSPAAPMLGEDNFAVYGDLGYSTEEVLQLREAGVI